MADIKLDRRKTALLMADFHISGIGSNPVARERHTLERAKAVLDAARAAGVLVVYCVSNFRPGYPEASDRNKASRARKASGEPLAADPLTLITPSVLPVAGEPVVVKHRTGAFYGSDLEMILRAHDIDTLVLLGHSTGGVILSTVRYAADADYRLVVVEDGCADPSPEVHQTLMEKVFPRQADVVSSREAALALAAG